MTDKKIKMGEIRYFVIITVFYFLVKSPGVDFGLEVAARIK